jgi:hypothetical protein
MQFKVQDNIDRGICVANGPKAELDALSWLAGTQKGNGFLVQRLNMFNFCIYETHVTRLNSGSYLQGLMNAYVMSVGVACLSFSLPI